MLVRTKNWRRCLAGELPHGLFPPLTMCLARLMQQSDTGSILLLSPLPSLSLSSSASNHASLPQHKSRGKRAKFFPYLGGTAAVRLLHASARSRHHPHPASHAPTPSHHQARLCNQRFIYCTHHTAPCDDRKGIHTPSHPAAVAAAWSVPSLALPSSDESPMPLVACTAQSQGGEDAPSPARRLHDASASMARDAAAMGKDLFTKLEMNLR